MAPSPRPPRSVRELVAQPPDRDQMPGVMGIGLDLLTEALHMHVEGLGVTDVVGAPDVLDQEQPGEQAILTTQERLEQLELLRWERDALTAHPHLVARDVHLDRTSTQYFLGRSHLAPHVRPT